MQHLVVFAVWLSMVVGLPVAVCAGQGATRSDTTVREAVEELKKVYATDIVLGKPLDVEGVKIIPLAAVGIGYGQRDLSVQHSAMQAAGGVLSPVGVLVISKHGVQLLPISKGLLEQLLGTLTPLVLQQLGHAEDQAAPAGERPVRLTSPAFLATLFALLPTPGLQFGVFPWPLSLVVLFVVGWLALALILVVFLPRQSTALAAILQENVLQAGLTGLLGYGVVCLLAVVFAISVIGIPVAVVLLVLAWALTLFGMIGMALLVGQRCVVALGRPTATDAVAMLLGGILLGIIRLIPVLGWIVWLILGVCGFGAVLRLRRRTAQHEAQSA